MSETVSELASEDHNNEPSAPDVLFENLVKKCGYPHGIRIASWRCIDFSPDKAGVQLHVPASLVSRGGCGTVSI
jgi:hypothetical protein